LPRYNGIAPKERHDQIEFAFTSGGINYFRFSADVNIPFQRAVAARDILTEELWQINPAVLQSWNEALIAMVIVFCLMLPIVGIMYFDTLATQKESKAQIERMERLRKQLEEERKKMDQVNRKED